MTFFSYVRVHARYCTCTDSVRYGFTHSRVTQACSVTTDLIVAV